MDKITSLIKDKKSKEYKNENKTKDSPYQPFQEESFKIGEKLSCWFIYLKNYFL